MSNTRCTTSVFVFILLLAGLSQACALPSEPTTPWTTRSDFQLSVASQTIGASTRYSGTDLVTITPESGFTDPVTFGCSGLPAGTTCSFVPPTITPAGEPATTTMTITYRTPAPSADPAAEASLASSGVLTLAAFSLGCFKRRRIAAFLLLAGITVFATGCGSSNSRLQTVPITLTATSPSQSHSVGLLLTIQ